MTRSLSAAAVLSLLLGLVVPCAQAAEGTRKVEPKIYGYRQSNGVRVFTDQRPENVAYSIISKFGRPTATASCTGLTPLAMKQRENSYEQLITKYANEHGIKPALVRAVMRVESCFDRRAVSRVGARGLMQLMPATAAELGVSDSFDAEQNIKGGVRYLKMMLDRFNQNVSFALAAYNAGPNAVAKHGGIPPFTETRKYVKRILELYNSQQT